MININGKSITTLEELRECFLELDVENLYTSSIKELLEYFHDGDIYVLLQECGEINLAKQVSEIRDEDSPEVIINKLSSVILTKDLIIHIADGAEIVMKYVEGGTFWMGAQNTNPDGRNFDVEAYSDESPVHEVTLDSFYIGETMVTQALWKAVMGIKVTKYGGWEKFGVGNNYPAFQISWYDCMDFIRQLNRITGKKFRLPTEAEWEYAARGGNRSHGYKYSGSNDINQVAWYKDNSEEKIHEVKLKQANELGLFDMSGSFNEWCSDMLDDYSLKAQTNPNPQFSSRNNNCRVNRGGCFWSKKNHFCSITCRGGNSPYGGSFDGFGLRLTLSLSKTNCNRGKK